MSEKTHWSQTPEGRARLSKISKRNWRKRRKMKKRTSIAARAVKAAVKKGKPKAQRPPRMDVRVLSVNPDGNLERERVSLRTWGALVDLMTGKYAGIVVEEVTVEVGR